VNDISAPKIASLRFLEVFINSKENMERYVDHGADMISVGICSSAQKRYQYLNLNDRRTQSGVRSRGRTWMQGKYGKIRISGSPSAM
jgi:hypothetical protein